MNYEKYDAVRIFNDLSSLDFISVGRHGEYPKRILFLRSDVDDIYYLVFGNIVAEDEVDDFSVNDNGDRNKILATVAEAVNNYTKRYPHRSIYFSGSTKQRTRLYRMAIFVVTLQHMEEKQKVIKMRDSQGREYTYIVDPSLDGVAERTKLPKKYQDVNERLRKFKLPK